MNVVELIRWPLLYAYTVITRIEIIVNREEYLCDNNPFHIRINLMMEREFYMAVVDTFGNE
jgi:hypothetical protein